MTLTDTGFLVILILAVLASAFIAYWIGRDAGENSVFVKKFDQTERLLKDNTRLKLEILSLRKSLERYETRFEQGIFDDVRRDNGDYDYM